MWADLFYTHPALYVALYILLDGLFAGLIALIGYAFSFYITLRYDPNAAIILIEAVMLFCSAIAIIFKRGVWHE